MHDSSFFNLKHFFKEYYSDKSNEKVIILDIGSQTSDIDKLKRWKEIFPKNSTYLGVDLVEANNVDLVLEDPYVYPFNDNYADIIIANSIFEHSEFFWVLFSATQSAKSAFRFFKTFLLNFFQVISWALVCPKMQTSVLFFAVTNSDQLYIFFTRDISPWINYCRSL